MRAWDRWRQNVQRARYLVPAERLDQPVRRRWTVFQGAVIMSLFDLNDLAITRFGGDLPSVYDTSQFDWVPRLEAATDDIRADLERYVAAHTSLPHVAEVSGLEPGTDEAMNSAPIDRGEWRVLILLANGKWIDETADQFPSVRRAVAGGPQMTTVGFSALEGHSHIAGHVGTNRGALRYQLPIVVPGEPGDCRIAIGDEMVVWQTGKSVIFDLGTWHEAWNDSDSRRVLFMIETEMPLRPPLRWLNRFVQYQYRFFPSFKAMPDRVRELERERAKALSSTG
ncbi:MAG TPA: aspartyl/asparaginyl beta-hydroxylase domain-containing protein [Acidimicrobiales bacterium]|nr:aspartyl/asparaginyl beta-hydroxylase domain-containing protein [Acidimicrobiales bacterium]